MKKPRGERKRGWRREPEEATEMQKDDPDNIALACFEEGFYSDKEPVKLWGVR